MVGQATNRKDLLKSSGNTADIISAILYADSQSASYTKELATQLRKATVLDTCRAIWDFVKQNIEYKEDPDGFQFVQSPGHLYWGDKAKGNGQGDCKSMSVFCGSILQNLGIKYAFRFVSQDSSKDLHHVFIVVPDETGKIICLDCVDDSFNAHYHFSKVKDVLPQHLQAISKIGAKVGAFALYEMDQTPTEQGAVVKNFGINYKNWSDYINQFKDKMLPAYKIEVGILLERVKDDWNSTRAWSALEPISLLLLSARGEKKVNGYFEDMLDKAVFHQLMYCYWDDSEATMPTQLANKRNQANLLKEGLLNNAINTRITAGFKDKNKPKYFNEYNLKVYCDYHCYITYGLPLAVLLRKAYNLVNMGSSQIPVDGWPYYNLKTGQWVPNGASAQDLANLNACLPFSGGNFRPFGVPYWCNGGFVMPNGASDATVKYFIEKNPIPAGLVPVEDRITTVNKPDGTFWYSMPSIDYIYYTHWWNDGLINNNYSIRLSTNPEKWNGVKSYSEEVTNKQNGGLRSWMDPQSASVNGKNKIGLAPVVIAAIITAVVTIIVSLLSFISQMLNKKKTEKEIENDITNYPVDFQNSYTSVDGCFMEATHNGFGGGISYTKRCPDGTVTPNANPKDPENIPANGITGLLGNLKSAWPLMLASAGIGLLLLFSSSSKKSKA